MNEKKKQEIPMPFKFDDFFTTQEQRDEEAKEHIEEIDISLIDNFKDHPFKVIDNDDMKSLKESIKVSGVLSPVIVREKEDGRYEMISGHRRKYACESLGIDKIKCIITDIEMPIMDGHRLTKLVKSDDATKDIPLIIFSSLVNEEMRRKGESLGADRQLSKPEIGNLVSVIDELVNASAG